MTEFQKRPIREDEAAVVEWMLRNARQAGSDPRPFTHIQALQVVGACECGCATVDFQEDRYGSHVLADAVAVYEDGKMAGVILWSYAARITSLEIYEMDEVADRIPPVSAMRRWEDLAECGETHSASK